MTGRLAKAAARFSETTIDTETVVMDLDSGDFFSLTGTARAIWEMIDGTRNRAALIAALASEFAQAPGDIAADVDAFLAQLLAAGFVGET